MPRNSRIKANGFVHHVFNRGVEKRVLFKHDVDYAFFIRIIKKAQLETGIKILSFCLMPNHWHFLLLPERDMQMSEFMKKVTERHAKFIRKSEGTTGLGHVYQSRYKALVAETDEDFLRLICYVESNPLKSGLVSNLKDWKWSSYWFKNFGNEKMVSFLAELPLNLPDNYSELLYIYK